MTDLQFSRLFQRALDKYGPPQGGEPAPATMLESYQGRVPDDLLKFWAEYGLGLWMKGYFQFCNPETYKPILEYAFGNDDQLKPGRSHVIGFSAFGRLLVWNEDYRVTKIDTLNHNIFCRGLFKEPPQGSTNDIAIGIALSQSHDEANDPGDEDGKPLFKRVLKACGPLSYGQIYGLNLIPALGGAIRAENFAPKDAEVALTIAAQADAFRLIDSSTPQMRAVRLLGG